MVSNKFPKNAKKVFSWKIFNVYNREQELFDWSKAIFEWIERKPCITALARDKEWNYIILKERQPWKNWFYWLISWMIEEWEEPLDWAIRELWEETWYEFDKIELIWVHDDWWEWGKMQSNRYMYFADWWIKTKDQKLDPWEEIIVNIIKKEDINEFLESKFSDFDKNLIKKYFKDKLPK